MRRHHLLTFLILTAGCSLFGGDEPEDYDLDLDPAGPAQAVPQPLALFAVHSANVVVPLACTQPGWGAFQSGTACLEMLPDGEVELDIGQGQTASVIDRTSVQCLSGRAASALDVSRMIGAWPVVTWSPGPVPWCAFAKAAEGERLDAPIEAALQRTAAQLDLGLEPPDPSEITIEPVYRVDLDGDGQEDHIARAIWPEIPVEEPELEEGEEPPPPPPPPQQEMLVLIGGYQALRFDLPLPQLVEITGAVDLDHDGRCELIVAAEREDGSSVALARWTGKRVELLTAYECGI
jgi:hypothetical protein